MRSADADTHAAAARWDIATPSQPHRLPGIRMAGFRDTVPDLHGLPVVPFPAVTVVLDLSESLVVEDGCGARQRGNMVVGLVPNGLRAHGRGVEVLQVRLSPVLAHRALGATVESSEGVIALDDLWGRDSERLVDQLRSARSWEARFSIAEQAFVRRSESGWTTDAEVGWAWQQMVSSNGQVRVEQIADELGWSRKRLWSRFRSQVGAAPKRASQLVRFDHAAHRLAAGEPPSLVAAEAGYVDQSHLHRDVATFAGDTPRGVADAPWLAVDDVAWAPPPSNTSPQRPPHPSGYGRRHER